MIPDFPSAEYRRFAECFTDNHGRAPDIRFTREVCGECGGRGAHVLHGHAFTESERDEMGEEWYDFVEEAQAGVYDTECHTCHGNRVVDEPRGGSDIDHWSEWVRDMHDLAALEAAERRMGA